MYWIIEENTFDEPFYERLIPFLKRMDIPFEINEYIPFRGGLVREPKPTQRLVNVIGSYGMTDYILSDYDFVPGVFTNSNYDYRVWSEKWGDRCLNRPGTVSKFGEVAKREGDFFIRPCADSKSFTGTVKNWEEFLEWQDAVINKGRTYTDHGYDTPVVVTEAKNIKEEYRFIVVDGRVVTGSLYKSGPTGLHKECTDPGLYEEAQSIVDIWTPSRAFALDLCIHDGKVWVLEMGNVNAAALYDCDVQKFVLAIEEMEF